MFSPVFHPSTWTEPILCQCDYALSNLTRRSKPIALFPCPFHATLVFQDQIKGSPAERNKKMDLIPFTDCSTVVLRIHLLGYHVISLLVRYPGPCAWPDSHSGCCWSGFVHVIGSLGVLLETPRSQGRVRHRPNALLGSKMGLVVYRLHVLAEQHFYPGQPHLESGIYQANIFGRLCTV